MRVSLYAIILCLLSPGINFSVKSQDLSKYYIHHKQDGGDLYFIYPFDDFRNLKDGSDFTFDITYRQGNDSAVINFTYFTSDPLVCDSLIFVTQNQHLIYKSQKIFQDFKKRHWINRFTLIIPYDELVSLVTKENPPEIKIITPQAKMVYTVKDKKWATYANALEKILYIIKS